MSHACHGFWTCYKTLTFCSLLTRLRLPRETRSERPKVAQTCGALYILTSKCASRHNGVHFFDIATSKSGPTLVCFVHFDFEIWFAPQRRAFFRHLNFQKWSQREVFLALSLTHVLRATTACTFSSLIWPDGSAPAALASLLFDPPEPQIIGKTECFATFLPFRASASSFFWLFLFSDLLSSSRLFSLPLPISAFHLSILSEVWLLKFLRQLYIIIYIYIYIHPQNWPWPPPASAIFIRGCRCKRLTFCTSWEWAAYWSICSCKCGPVLGCKSCLVRLGTKLSWWCLQQNSTSKICWHQGMVKWRFPKMGVPQNHPKLNHFSIETYPPL